MQPDPGWSASAAAAQAEVLWSTGRNGLGHALSPLGTAYADWPPGAKDNCIQSCALSALSAHAHNCTFAPLRGRFLSTTMHMDVGEPHDSILPESLKYHCQLSSPLHRHN